MTENGRLDVQAISAVLFAESAHMGAWPPTAGSSEPDAAAANRLRAAAQRGARRRPCAAALPSRRGHGMVVAASGVKGQDADSAHA
jgi:glycine/D-amino acid oxidase-like deaminating enzyme